jgi:calpain-15
MRAARERRYVVRLYHPVKQRWVLITVDDYFPCSKGTKTPLFAKPNGRELWVMVLEKAYAKFLGGFDRLDGGVISVR